MAQDKDKDKDKELNTLLKINLIKYCVWLLKNNVSILMLTKQNKKVEILSTKNKPKNIADNIHLHLKDKTVTNKDDSNNIISSSSNNKTKT